MVYHWFMEGVSNKYIVNQFQTLLNHCFNSFTLKILSEIIVIIVFFPY